jgi:hypothetical protein
MGYRLNVAFHPVRNEEGTFRLNFLEKESASIRRLGESTPRFSYTTPSALVSVNLRAA